MSVLEWTRCWRRRECEGGWVTGTSHGERSAYSADIWEEVGYLKEGKADRLISGIYLLQIGHVTILSFGDYISVNVHSMLTF